MFSLLCKDWGANFRNIIRWSDIFHTFIKRKYLNNFSIHSPSINRQMQQCSFTRILSNFFAPLIVPSRVTQSTLLKKKSGNRIFKNLKLKILKNKITRSIFMDSSINFIIPYSISNIKFIIYAYLAYLFSCILLFV